MGDYATLLAGECERRGHTTRMLALNDTQIDSIITGEDSLRLPSTIPWKERVTKAREFISAFSPDFVSLQFVCYGFHPRGIDFGLAGRLREIIGKRAVQIMFHELWIGAEQGAPLKDRFVGNIQRSLLLRLPRMLDARVIHTSNASYVAMLRERNVSAEILPLFGAIPINCATPVPRGDALALGMFGALPPVWPPEPLFSLLAATGRKITVAHIGDIGAGESLWDEMERKYRGRVEFKRLGRQSPDRIAQFLDSEIDLGIATVPWELAGKSAAVAAMLEHGLPVIVNRDDWHLNKATDATPVSAQLIKMDETLPQKLSTPRRVQPQSRLPETATQFLNAMESAA